jgi:NTE family protein
VAVEPMGLTIVQKSDLGVRKKNPKIALVLAGGAVTGGAFKLGGLKALDDFLVNRKTTELDTYVGLSAGAVLAAPLSTGISPAEMVKSLEGESSAISRFTASDFYSPNIRELVERPIDYVLALASYIPGLLTDVVRDSPSLLDNLRAPLRAYVAKPTPGRLRDLFMPIVETVQKRRSFPSPLDFLPSGLFDNSSIERYIRHNLERGGLSNDFRTHYRRTKRELYISAMNLDTAERVVFGYDEDASVTISEAVQASTAVPGFYRPARIKGVDYVDGGVRRTANIDVAIEHGADLVICYNPFRPFSNRVRRRFDRERGTYVYDGQPLADSGMLSIMNQILRTMLHSRLQYGLRQYQDDPNFQGDIIVVEPKETDVSFFRLNVFSYWERLRAAQLGYLSVTESIEQNYDLIRPMLERYGITMTRREVRQGVERIREEELEEATGVLTREVPRRKLSVA